jgi:hypothetical protein
VPQTPHALSSTARDPSLLGDASERAAVYARDVATTSGLGYLAALLVLTLACGGSRLDGAKDGGRGDVADSAAHDAPDDSGCGADVNLMNDPNNCGGCGIRCCVHACTNGACFCDGVGLTCCPTNGRGADGCYFQNIPVSPVSDSCHCGGCGIACPTGTTCSNGTCVAADGGAGCRQP